VSNRDDFARECDKEVCDNEDEPSPTPQGNLRSVKQSFEFLEGG
jgi:hypothetical protein